MSRGVVSLWLLTIAVTATVLSLAFARSARAEAAFENARNVHARATAAVTQRRALVEELPEWARRQGDAAEGTEEALASRVSSALASAGLAPSVLTSFQADASLPAGQTQHVALYKSRAVITLDGPTLPQIGAFLQTWRSREPHYVVASIDLSPLPAPSRGAKDPGRLTGGDAPLHAVITVESRRIERKAKDHHP